MPSIDQQDPLKVATYTRKSTDEEHQPYSLKAQAARLEAYVSSQPGWTLSRTFTDSVSGATLDRPGQAVDPVDQQQVVAAGPGLGQGPAEAAVVKIMLDRYVNVRLGSHVLAAGESEAGLA